MTPLKLVLAGAGLGVVLASTAAMAQENTPAASPAAPVAETQQEAPAPPPPAQPARAREPQPRPDRNPGAERQMPARIRERAEGRTGDGSERAAPRPAPTPSPAEGASSGDTSAPRMSEAQRSRGRRRTGDAQAVSRTQPRPRGDNRTIGRAVPRTDAPAPPRVTYVPGYRTYSNVYFPWGYGAFGPGFFYYDPFWWGYNSAYYSNYGWAGRHVDYYYTGTLRLKVKPREAQVFADGYFVGVVDEFDGILQSLKLESGPHRIEIRLAGYEALIFDVRIIPGETVTYRGVLKPLRP